MLEELFLELCDPWPDAWFLLDREGRLRTANRAGTRMLGLSDQEVAGKKITDLVNDPTDEVACYLAACSQSRQPIPGMLSRAAADGSLARYQCLGHQVRGAGGTPLVFLRCSQGKRASSQFVALNKRLHDQLNVQRQMKAERDLLESIAQNIGAGLRIISKDYKTLWANSVIRDIFGDTVGKTCYSTYSRLKAVCPWCGVRKIFEQGMPSLTSESTGYDKEGNRIVSEIFSTALYDEQGDITSALELVIPITKRKQAERQLKDDEKRAESLLALSQLPWATRDEFIGHAVEEAVRLTGSTAGYLHVLREDQQTIELVYWSEAVFAECRTVPAMMHYPLAEAGIWADCARLRQAVIHNDYPDHPGRKGLPAGHFPVRHHMSVPIIDNGAVTAIAGVGNKGEPYDAADARQLSLFMDGMWSIFKQKRMALEVLRAKEEWELTFDAIDEVVTIHDLEMKIVRANKATVLMMGVEPAELIGKYCFEVFSGLDQPCPGCPEVLARADYAPHLATIFHEKLAKTVEVSSSPLVEGGRVKGFVHIAKDVTQRKMLEAQLRQAQKMEAIGTLAGGIAHDFNNILAPILGYAELALDRVSAADPVNSDLKQIAQAAERAKELVKQILSFSRHTTQERWPLAPHLVIKEVLKLLRSSLPSTIEIRQEIATDCGSILGDPTQLHQIIMNLCTNAYHAMRVTGGVLGVSLAKRILGEGDPKAANFGLAPGPYMLLKVSDTGLGMDRSTLERIFEPYFTTKSKGEGTGLGLSVVHGIVKSYHGHIAVDSEPEVGTTFQVYLPLAEEKPSLPEAPSPVTVSTGSERILVVDDEKSITSMLRLMLGRAGYQVTATNQSAEALALFEQDPEAFDLLITDMTMPGYTGLDLAKKVLAIRPLPIILITGFSELIDKEKATAAGIREFLMKPVSSWQLADAMRKVLDGG